MISLLKTCCLFRCYLDAFNFFLLVDIIHICLFALLSSSYIFSHFVRSPISLTYTRLIIYFFYTFVRNNTCKMIYLILNALNFPLSWRPKNAYVNFKFHWMPTIKKEIRYLNLWFQHIFHLIFNLFQLLHSLSRSLSQTLTLPSGKVTLTIHSGKVSDLDTTQRKGDLDTTLR